MRETSRGNVPIKVLIAPAKVRVRPRRQRYESAVRRALDTIDPRAGSTRRYSEIRLNATTDETLFKQPES